MSVTPLRRVVVMPGVIERPDGVPSSPVEAVRRLLASHVQAPHLLSEARHRAVVARESAAEAVQEARLARDAELAYELAVRDSDRRGRRGVHFWPAAVSVGALLGICWAAAFVLLRAVPWPDRVVVAVAAVVLGGAAAWRVSATRERDGGHHTLVCAAAAWAAALVVLCILSTSGGIALRVGAAIVLGVALVAADAAVVWVLERAESWRCFRLRRASSRAARRRQAALAEVSCDEAAATAALAAWESLVVEECQLAHPGDVAGETWLADCVSVARSIAAPELPHGLAFYGSPLST